MIHAALTHSGLAFVAMIVLVALGPERRPAGSHRPNPRPRGSLAARPERAASPDPFEPARNRSESDIDHGS